MIGIGVNLVGEHTHGRDGADHIRMELGTHGIGNETLSVFGGKHDVHINFG